MDKIIALGLIIIVIGLGITLGSQIIQQEAHPTGCPVDTIIPMLDEAIKSLEAGDTQTALSQMKDAKNELSDTFEVE